MGPHTDPANVRMAKELEPSELPRPPEDKLRTLSVMEKMERLRQELENVRSIGQIEATEFKLDAIWLYLKACDDRSELGHEVKNDFELLRTAAQCVRQQVLVEN